MTLKQRLSLLLRGYYLVPCSVPGWGWVCFGRDGFGSVGQTRAKALEHHKSRVVMRKRAGAILSALKGL
jgi:hypothetical protein